MPAMKMVLITDAVDELLIKGLQAAGYHCDYRPKINQAQVLDCIAQYDGIIINSKIRVNRHFLDIAEKLAFVGRLGSGLEIIDLDYAAARGVAVYNSPSGNCDAVAEHALGMVLAWAIQLRQADQQVRQKIWKREANRGWELMGRTIGIVGFGHTGSAFARRLSGFGVRVLAYDKYKFDYTRDLGYAEETSLEAIQEQAEVISFHLPLTEETQHFADAVFFDRLKKQPLVVNTSRGQVVDTSALLEALEKNKIKGACLDVFENEKPETYSPEQETLLKALFQRTDVLFSPHVAGWTFASKKRLARILLAKILKKYKA